jgi:LemA protein
MTTGSVVLIIVLVLIIAGVLFLIAIYNALVALRNQVKNAWSQIDVQLKRRHDLIPNLIETTKGYMQHERQTLEAVTQARSAASGARGVADIAKAETELSHVLTRFMAVAENYPDLKANQNFLALQEELTSTENKIAFARQAYNDAVLFLNNKVEMFPSNLVAVIFYFHKEQFFELEDAADKAAPKVNFS